MAGLNKASIIGHLGKDPEIKYLDNGTACCRLSVATAEKWKDKSGELKEHTEWHRITLWGKTAENAAKYLAKGRQVYVEGKIQTRKYTDKEGVERYATEIVGSEIQFLGSGKGDGGSKSPEEHDGWKGHTKQEYINGGSSPDDDIPF